MDQLFRFPGSVKRDPAVVAWMNEHSGDLGAIAKHWFGVRHVKLRPEVDIDATALIDLIESAYTDMKRRLEGISPSAP